MGPGVYATLDRFRDRPQIGNGCGKLAEAVMPFIELAPPAKNGPGDQQDLRDLEQLTRIQLSPYGGPPYQ